MVLRCFSTLVLGLSVGRSEVVEAEPFNLQYLPDAPDARTIAGTPAYFYYRSAVDIDASTWVIFMEGGSDCTDLAHCEKIRKSHESAPSSSWSAGDYPIFQRDPKANVHFATVHHVYVPYLTGDFHAGTRCNKPWLGRYHFCGHRHLEATVDALKARGLANSSRVVLSGCSTGGMGVFRNLDWLQGKLATEVPQTEVIGIAFSGFYFFQHPFTGPGARSVQDFGPVGFERYYDLHGAFVNAECRERLEPSGLQWMCQQANYSSSYIRTPLFVAEDQTDKVVMGYHAGVELDPSLWGPQMTAYVQDWQVNMSIGLTSFFDDCTLCGVFSPKCFDHCGNKIGHPLIEGHDVMFAINLWVSGLIENGSSKVWLSDSCEGLICNPTCDGSEHIAVSV